ncbi:MAG: M14 family zinc carboxypeptidase [Gaiellaceae bacterium]
MSSGAPGRRGVPGRLRLDPIVGLLAAFDVLLLASPSADGAQAKRVLLGRSLDGRAIEAVEVGDPAGRRVLVVGCVHGNEPAGIAVAQRLVRLSPRGLDLWVVPDLNPDGRAANTRGNAHGVDLNRNFPYRWRPLGGVFESGPRPLSEREARIAYRLILELRPSVSIWFHQHLNLVWASGGDRNLERRFARVAGLPYRALPALAGSAIDWQNHRLPDTTAFAAELPAGAAGTVALDRYVRAVLALGGG